MTTLTDGQYEQMIEFAKHDENSPEILERTIIKGMTVIKVKSRDLSQEELDDFALDDIL